MTAGGTELNVILLAQDRPEALDNSESVWVTWEPDDATVLPGEATSPPAAD